ncbi:MAG TPA: RelA/SpoT family protein, partial [Fibrobacteria bacterium]|nr:RelA/SpoT family protein [Fibrobacteria bacterium]
MEDEKGPKQKAAEPSPAPIAIREKVLPDIPGVEPVPESGDGHDPEIKGPEIERSLDRAKENLVSYIAERIPAFDKQMIQKAIDFSMMAHKNQFRRSGMPYAEHPFEVAKLLADLGMDGTTIVAGLLHDVVEDTSHSISEVRELFGEDVAFLVEAVTKISAIKSKSRADQQAETFRKMLISMAKDIRVIMIKFADRLHNMRTLSYMKEERKRAIAAETIEVYAPLAHRFGLARIKWELEDLAFKHLNPDAYKNLVKKVVEKRQEREEYVRGILAPVKDALRKAGIEGKVFGRPKHLHSIWEKMQARQCGFEDIYDLYALRVIVGTVADCYAVLGLVHSIWTPLQSRFKDYIATPKSNMYQSLHTTLIGPGGKPVEIQIRTEEMDLIAEQGIAAHWGYKEKKGPKDLGKENKWLKQFLEWQQDLTDSHEFMEYFRGDLATGEIFVFTPTGDLVQLPKGATALDFAFALHSALGLKCIGAKVDGNVVPLYRELQTGERVEILKSETQRPSKDWLSIVVTTK